MHDKCDQHITNNINNSIHYYYTKEVELILAYIYTVKCQMLE